MSDKQFHFVSHNGSYTLVLKESDGQIIYNHKGVPTRHTKAHFCEFQLQKSGYGTFSTDDYLVAELIRNSKAFGKAITEVKTKKELKEKQKEVEQIKLPKSALMACNKDELIKVAKTYNIELGNDDTKKIMVEKILEKQNTSKGIEEGAGESAGDGSIDRIIQK